MISHQKDAVALLIEIKEQLDRVEENINLGKIQTEQIISEIKEHLSKIPTEETGLPKHGSDFVGDDSTDLTGIDGLLDTVKNLPDMEALLENPQKLLNSPIVKLLPLFTSDRFAQTLDIVQKIQTGKLPAPSELLPVVKLFLPQPLALTAQSSPKISRLKTMQNELFQSKLDFQEAIDKINSLNNEAMALLEMAELFVAKKQRVH